MGISIISKDNDFTDSAVGRVAPTSVTDQLVEFHLTIKNAQYAAVNTQGPDASVVGTPTVFPAKINFTDTDYLQYKTNTNNAAMTFATVVLVPPNDGNFTFAVSSSGFADGKSLYFPGGGEGAEILVAGYARTNPTDPSGTIVKASILRAAYSGSVHLLFAVFDDASGVTIYSPANQEIDTTALPASTTLANLQDLDIVNQTFQGALDHYVDAVWDKALSVNEMDQFYLDMQRVLLSLGVTI